MKSLKLELLPLEDRSVPATLTTRVAVSPPPSDATAAVVASAPQLALAATAAPQSSPLGKLAANHNLTLVRDRRGRKSRGR